MLKRKTGVAGCEPSLDSDRWVIFNNSPGARQIELEFIWRQGEGGWSDLGKEHSGLLNEFKVFMYTLMVNKQWGGEASPTTLRRNMSDLQTLARFAVDVGLTSIGRIDSSTSMRYVSWLQDNYEAGSRHYIGRPRKLSYSSANGLLSVMSAIYAQSRPMLNLGVSVLPEAPFFGRTAFDVVVNDLGLTKGDGLEPLNDRFASSLLDVAYRWVSYGIEDVLRIYTEVAALRDEYGGKIPAKVIGPYLESFQFSADPTSGRPWHEPFAIIRRDRLDGKRGPETYMQWVRWLIIDMTAACAICLQGCTGMAAGELLSISGEESSDLLLKAITTRPSRDKMMEMFFVAGVRAKGVRQDEEWLLGMRPAGSIALPIAVRALRAVTLLTRPMRARSGRSNLWLTFSQRKGLAKVKGSLGLITVDRLTALQKAFATYRLTDLGWDADMLAEEVEAFRAHRWRTTLAVFVFRTSPDLLIPLRDHFKHISEAVTDGAYIGSNAALITDLEDAASQETSRILLEISTGKAFGAGSVKRLLQKEAKNLAALLEKSKGGTQEERALTFVQEHDLRIWNGTYATCLMSFQPRHSRCNAAIGMPEAIASAPIYSIRTPDMCAGCRNAWISPGNPPTD